MTRPAAPSRATAKYSLSFGLMVIPVKMLAGCEESGVKRSMRTPEGDPIGNANLRKLPEGGYDLTRTYEKSEVRYVVPTDSGEVELTDDDILRATDTVRGDGEKVMEVVCTQPLDLLNTGVYVTENLYQIRADKAAVKPYATLLAALADESCFALVKFPTRAFVRYGALLPDGRLFTLRYHEEVRENADLPYDTLGEAVEAQARQLVRAFLDTDARELCDEISDAIRAYAEAKAEGQPQPEPVASDSATVSAETFLAALSASVDALREQGGATTPASKRKAVKRATAPREKVSS